MLTLPKVDLHLHLDGSLRVETVLELALERKIKLPSQDPEQLAQYLQVPDNCPNLTDYLKRFELPLEILQDEESLERAAWELVEDLKAENVCYGEIRYAPNLHLEKGLKPKKVVEAVLQGVQRAGEKYGVETGVILCCMRHQDPEVNKDVVRLAGDHLGGGVVAIDLAGDEVSYPVDRLKDVFTFAQGAGLPYTIHAGEAAGPESIRLALELGACRIGHGVQAKKDPALIKILREKGVILEMCPTSNVQTKAVANLAEHPLAEYFEQGLKVTINTDNRTVSHTTLTREYELIKEQFSLGETQLRQMNLYAIEGAFTTEGIKEKVRKIINQ